MKHKTLPLWLLFLLFSVTTSPKLFAESSKILITEFMAINSKTLQDENGDYSDWIELYNPGDSAINLNGWYLTDDAVTLTKWKFPDIMLKSNGYLVVFASDKNRVDPAGKLHTNFKLSGTGEYLAIVEPDGITVANSYNPAFPSQREDISFGQYQGQMVYFTNPTPGLENVFGSLPFAPNFSLKRGFYSTPFDVTLSVPGNDAIYYTTDGTRPSRANGTLYQGPIRVQTTTPLSAVAINTANLTSEIVTHTYLFSDSIVRQSNNPKGYPSTWSPYSYKDGYAPADYEMDPEVCFSNEYKNLITDAFKSIPSLAIVTNPGYIFSSSQDTQTGGIYIYTGAKNRPAVGLDWERPTSVEYFDPKSGKEFQLNCGLSLHGGNSRVPENSPKHSFQLSFRTQYGPSKLNFNFFDESNATNEFNTLILRAGYNYSWLKNAPAERNGAQYLQDPFAKNTQHDMGHPAAHERFVHLYINGLYWGIYNVTEKLTNDFMETYLKGNEDDYDVVKDHSGLVDGTMIAWNNLLTQINAGVSSNASYQKLQGRNADGTVNAGYQNLLDMNNFIDYILLNFYIGNSDWDGNNWIAARNRVTNNAGFRLFSWDGETTMTSLSYNNVTKNTSSNPTGIFQKLAANSDFKILLADHVQKNFFNGGPLSPQAAIERYSKLADEIDLAIIAESARWGDYRKDVEPSDATKVLYTRNDYWLTRKQDLISNYFPFRTDTVVKQLRQAGLFPNIEAPVFTHNGGKVSSEIDLGMRTNYGSIYYTMDGSDPRQSVTAGIASSTSLYQNPVHLSSNVNIRARAKSGSEWSPITEAAFDFDNTSAIESIHSATVSAGCFPNPFSESAQIYFTLPVDGDVQVDIIGIDGRLITNLFKGFRSNGYNQLQWTPDTHESGIFIYRIRFEGQSYFGKMIRK